MRRTRTRSSRHEIDCRACERNSPITVLCDIIVGTSKGNVGEDESRSGFDERVTGVAPQREKPNSTPTNGQVWKPGEIVVLELVIRYPGDAAIHISDMLAEPVRRVVPIQPAATPDGLSVSNCGIARSPRIEVKRLERLGRKCCAGLVRRSVVVSAPAIRKRRRERQPSTQVINLADGRQLGGLRLANGRSHPDRSTRHGAAFECHHRRQSTRQEC